MSRDQFIRMRGAWDTRHWIRIPALDGPISGERLKTSIEQLEGVRLVLTYPLRQKIRVTYDQTKIDYRKILNALAQLELPAAEDWLSKAKGNWFQYLDETARENARVPASPCCSNPTNILSKSKKRG